MLSSHALVAQAAGQQSILGWMMNSMSPMSFLALLIGFTIFGGACYLIVTKRRPAMISAYMVLLPLPLLVSLCGELKGIVASLSVMAVSDVTVTSAELAGGIAGSLFSVLAALMVSTPTYLLLAMGLLVRTAGENPSRSPAAV